MTFDHTQYQRDRKLKLRKQGICLNCAKRKAFSDRLWCKICLFQKSMATKARKGTGVFTGFDYKALLKKQKGRCAICNRKMKRAELDHDHKRRKIREFLCTQCNLGLGLFREDIHVFHRVIKYLEKHNG